MEKPFRPKDTNQRAKFIFELASGQRQETPTRNEVAAASGSLGGKKGGPARAKALSAKRRSEIARKAAQARWSK